MVKAGDEKRGYGGAVAWVLVPLLECQVKAADNDCGQAVYEYNQLNMELLLI